MAGRRILVVDDEPSILLSLAFVLKREGFEVDQARNGEEALEKARRSPPDLVFLDVMMPLKNGFDVLAEFKADPELWHARVVLLTAKGQDADREQAFKLGCESFLSKPFSTVLVVSVARKILGPAEPA